MAPQGGNLMNNLIDQIVELYFLGGNLQEILREIRIGTSRERTISQLFNNW